MEFQNWISESQLTESSTGSSAMLELIYYKLPQTKNSTELLKIVKRVSGPTRLMSWSSHGLRSPRLLPRPPLPPQQHALTAPRSRLGPLTDTTEYQLRQPKDKTLQESDFWSLVLCLASFQTVSVGFHHVVLLRKATGEAGFSRITHTHTQ